MEEGGKRSAVSLVVHRTKGPKGGKRPGGQGGERKSKKCPHPPAEKKGGGKRREEGRIFISRSTRSNLGGGRRKEKGKEKKIVRMSSCLNSLKGGIFLWLKDEKKRGEEESMENLLITKWEKEKGKEDGLYSYVEGRESLGPALAKGKKEGGKGDGYFISLSDEKKKKREGKKPTDHYSRTEEKGERTAFNFCRRRSTGEESTRRAFPVSTARGGGRRGQFF